MAALLESPNLRLQVENEAYYLLCAWIYQCPHLKVCTRKLFLLREGPTRVQNHVRCEEVGGADWKLEPKGTRTRQARGVFTGNRYNRESQRKIEENQNKSKFIYKRKKEGMNRYINRLSPPCLLPFRALASVVVCRKPFLEKQMHQPLKNAKSATITPRQSTATLESAHTAPSSYNQSPNVKNLPTKYLYVPSPISSFSARAMRPNSTSHPPD